MSAFSAAAVSCASSPRRCIHAPPSHKLQKRLLSFHQEKNKRLISLSRALPFDLSPPPIDFDPLEIVAVAEAEISQDGTANVCDNDNAALDAVDNGVAVVDLSDYGRIRVSGEDRIRFLHNQTTANFECLGEGQGCDTVFVTATARTIDISHAWVMKNAIMLVVSPMTCGNIIQMLKKYIFFADKVEIQDITSQTRMFALLGPKSNTIMENLNLGELVGQPYGTQKHYSVSFEFVRTEERKFVLHSVKYRLSRRLCFLQDACLNGMNCLKLWVGGMPLTVAVGSLISVEGFTFMMSPAAAGSVLKALLGQGASQMSSSAWETLRILRGRPTPGKELTNEYNVLEAGLLRAVSLNKGCYKGQETISRLITYDGIKQRLWGIQLSSPAESGSIITVDGKKVGKLTSFTAGTETSGPFGLGYVKRRTASGGDSVTVGSSIVGTLVEVPFLREQLPP